MHTDEYSSIYRQAQAVIQELFEKAALKPGNIVVVGCSTSEVLGAKIGTNSNPDTAKEIFEALHAFAKEHGIYLAIQCCEHLNRAIITERAAAGSAGGGPCSGTRQLPLYGIFQKENGIFLQDDLFIHSPVSCHS